MTTYTGTDITTITTATATTTTTTTTTQTHRSMSWKPERSTREIQVLLLLIQSLHKRIKSKHREPDRLQERTNNYCTIKKSNDLWKEQVDTGRDHK